jgi:hypothetical protein
MRSPARANAARVRRRRRVPCRDELAGRMAFGLRSVLRDCRPGERTSKNQKGTVMLVTFKCRASPDVMMMDNLAQYLLGIIGKRLGPRGVISHDELDVSISKLETAIATDKKERAEHEGHFHEGEEGYEHHELPVGLAQRAFPFLDMLRLAQKEQSDIVWGI